MSNTNKLTWEELCAAVKYATNNGIEIPGLDISRLASKVPGEPGPAKPVTLAPNGLEGTLKEESETFWKNRSGSPAPSTPVAPVPASRSLNGHVFSDEALDVLLVMHELGANVNRSRVLTHRSLKGLSTAKWDGARRELKREGAIVQHGTRNFAGYTLTASGLECLKANYT